MRHSKVWVGWHTRAGAVDAKTAALLIGCIALIKAGKSMMDPQVKKYVQVKKRRP